MLNFFSKYGEIVDILRKDDYAFIEFKDPEYAKEAVKQAN